MIKRLLSKRAAGIILIVSLIFMMIFHLLVVLKALPGDIVWGGTLDGDSVVMYELIAFAISGFMLFIAILKTDHINNNILRKTANVFIWIMVVYFAFMIFGNFSAKSLTEKVIFIPLSALMFISSLRLAMANLKNK